MLLNCGVGRRLLRVPWTARSNQSILKETNLEYSLERLILKFQYFGHLMWRVNSLEKTLILGKTEGRRRRGQQRMRRLDSITDSMDMSLRKLREDSRGQRGLACCSPWGHKSRTGLSNWMTTRSPFKGPAALTALWSASAAESYPARSCPSHGLREVRGYRPWLFLTSAQSETTRGDACSRAPCQVCHGFTNYTAPASSFIS